MRPAPPAHAAWPVAPRPTVVTIAWRAPDRPTEIVVLAPRCRVLASRLRRCRARSDVGRVTCLNAHLGRGLRDLERHEGPDGARRLRFRFPTRMRWWAPRGRPHTRGPGGDRGHPTGKGGCPASSRARRASRCRALSPASTHCRARNGTCDRSVDATFRPSPRSRRRTTSRRSVTTRRRRAGARPAMLVSRSTRRATCCCR